MSDRPTFISVVGGSVLAVVALGTLSAALRPRNALEAFNVGVSAGVVLVSLVIGLVLWLRVAREGTHV